MLVAESLTFSYPGRSTPVVEDWSERFVDGEVVAITGRSGRGKSTLLYLLGLMLRPSEGELRLDELATADLSDSSRAKLRSVEYGFVFQDAVLDSTRTVLDNVIEASLYRGADRALSIGLARDLLARFGVEVPPSAKPGQVSGGQAQRIALCRALLSEPNIVLADEPTGNLDPETAQVVLNALRDHAHSGAVVIVVSHDPEVVARCDRKIELA